MNKTLLFCLAILLTGSVFAQENVPLTKVINNFEGGVVFTTKVYLDSETKEYLTKKEYIKKYSRDEFRVFEEQVEVEEEKRDREGGIGNFHITGTGILWQYVYDTELTESQTREYFDAQTFMELQRKTDESMIFSIDKMSLDTRKVVSWGMTPFFLMEPMSGKVIVQCKDNRYRVTFSNIVFASSTNVTWGGVSTNSNSQSPLEEWAYSHRRNRFKSSFENTSAEIMNALLLSLFKVKELGVNSSDDW